MRLLWPCAVPRQETIMRNLRILVLKLKCTGTSGYCGSHQRFMCCLFFFFFFLLDICDSTSAWRLCWGLPVIKKRCHVSHTLLHRKCVKVISTVNTSEDSRVLLLLSMPCLHLFLGLSGSPQRYNILGVRQSLFSAADKVCKWKHHTLPKCTTYKCWSVKNTVCMTLWLCCREKENTVWALTCSLLLLASGLFVLIICHPALLTSENGHLTKTYTVGNLYYGTATSWLLQIPAYATAAAALHNSVFATL